jgi:OOP family OmpA-OmpF porin
MKKQLLGTLFLGASAILVAGAAEARDMGWYAGAGLGYSDFDSPISASELEALLAQGGVTATVSIDDTDTGWKLFGGYQVNRNLAVEAAWVDLGEVGINVNVSSPQTVSLGASSAVDGFALSAVGMLPIGDRLDLIGRLGIYSWDVSAQAIVTDGGTAVQASADDDGSDAVYGIGLEYDFNIGVTTRVEWERYDIGGDDVDLLSVSVGYQF